MGKEKSKILIVEDEILVAETIRRCMLQNGFNVTDVALSGEEAVLSARENSPDVAIVDIRLRDTMDGIEAARIIRDSYGASIIFLTAHSGMDMYSKAREVDHYAYIIKPFQEEQLVDAIRFTLKQIS